MNELSTKELSRLLAPFLAMTALVAVVVMLLLLKFLPGSPVGGGPSVVTFDVIRYTNAQRAVASTFLKQDADHASANELLANLSERTRSTIQSIAGQGTLVVLKQAVVQGQTRDITEEVLTELGLPTDVPTSDGASYSLDVAPTMMLSPPAPRQPKPLPGEDKLAGEGVLP